ncbi:MAG: Rpn family recombination-promoting nuclease/putative transposase [Desmonostoc geniculatum HA4340-LM1]|nr:Rpn family recombination-promoting nuclease/putative transposase [Desmonostoc geniculatum HA4340-LM1]
MRRDAIFYTLFKRVPGLLFELVEQPPAEAANYRFRNSNGGTSETFN